ncbi:MAG: hypothetical protein JWM87_2258 [Candidatus Eremiobacteraeota bacterium]|nr:hypothetical protein [Candidatus Eremiobacteraeota bacterium]
MNKIAGVLQGGDPRSLKGVTRAVDDVLHDPALFAGLVQAMEHDDPIVRMRAADAAEKITRTNPEYLEPYKGRVLNTAANAEQPSLRWHHAQMLPRLRLDASEHKQAVAILKRYLADRSAIVKTCAMQGLAEVAMAEPSLRRSILPLLRKATETGTAAMRARGRRLLEALEQRKTGGTP